MSKKTEYIPHPNDIDLTKLDELPEPSQEGVDAVMAEVEKGVQWWKDNAASIAEQMNHNELHNGIRTATVADPDGNPFTMTTIPNDLSDDEFDALLEDMGVI